MPYLKERFQNYQELNAILEQLWCKYSLLMLYHFYPQNET